METTTKVNMKEKIVHLNKEENRQQKSIYVHQMFNEIADKYDFMNRLMSGGIDIFWREFAIKKINPSPDAKILDLCTGTCDLALTAAKKIGVEGEVIGMDLSENMLKVGRQKVQNSSPKPFMALAQGKIESLPFKNEYFDVAMVSCGIRNSTDIPVSIKEMVRVVKKGGVVFSLDLGHPSNIIFDKLYRFYFFRIVPLMGRILAHREAYSYLPNSLNTFPNQQAFQKMFETGGLKRVHYHNLFGGAMALHIGYKE